MLEKDLTNMVSDYLQTKYPKVIYMFDVGADMRLSIGQAQRRKRIQGKWSRGNPDLFIAKANKGMNGLFIELKVTTPYKKNGELKKDTHLEEQKKFHDLLRKEGYHVGFFTGFSEVATVLDWYLK